MIITNIMLAFIAAGIFQIAHVLARMEIKSKITIHTKVTTEKRSDIELVDVDSKIQ